MQLKERAVAAKRAAFALANATTEQKNGVLQALVKHLKQSEEAILAANREDVALARSQRLATPLLERLFLENRIGGIVHDIQQVIALPDPIGRVIEEQTLPNQLRMAKMSTSIGVLGVIYESRPNVTLDIGALAIKSGNGALLRGGSESLQTNRVLVELIQRSLAEVGLPEQAIQLVGNGNRAEVKELLKLHEEIALIIPRGSSALQQFCREESLIPVVTGGIGICHLFVDETADLERSSAVILNAKTQRATVCNALDTLLVHQAVASAFIPEIVKRLGKAGVSFRMDERAWRLVQDPSCRLATEEDWNTEWLSLVLGVRVVENLEEAIEHIRLHSTGHSDGILTECLQNGELFVRAVDSAAVYINASTRFTDGGQFGFGAEVAISTQKLHARGPMGLKELTSYKWIVRGDYHVRG